MQGAATGGNDWEALVAEQVRLRGPLLFRLAYDVLKDVTKAEDVCQDVLLKALQMRSSIRNPDALKGWLARVVINESLLVCRRESCERRVHEVIRLRESSRESHDATRGGGDREALYAAIEELPQPTQAVVVLRLVQGMSGNQVKDLLGMNASEVSRKLHEGMDYLRERLASARFSER